MDATCVLEAVDCTWTGCPGTAVSNETWGVGGRLKVTRGLDNPHARLTSDKNATMEKITRVFRESLCITKSL
jgi:hypothetical protein